jgi:uncharacterized membrane protein YgcG
LDFRAGIGHAFTPQVVMRPLHRVLFVLAALAAIQGVQACASETPDPGLNPQPLPPEDQKDNTREPEGAQDPNTGVGGGATSGSSSSGGSSGSPVADGDAGDGGGGDSGGDN